MLFGSARIGLNSLRCEEGGQSSFPRQKVKVASLLHGAALHP